MNDAIVSPMVFRWILTALTGVFAVAWLVYDLRNMVVLRRADGGDPLVRDKRFGYFMGIAIAIIGIFGVLRAHQVI